jgi:hypothetical protein
MASFLDNIERISSSEYKPLSEDILKLYFPTLGLNDTLAELPGRKVVYREIAGCNSNTKAWLPYCDSLDAIAVVVPLSDQNDSGPTAEDNEQNKETTGIRQALQLCDEICKYSRQTRRAGKSPQGWPSVLLFLNKLDIFKEDIALDPLYFELPHCSLKELKPEPRYRAVAEHILKQFTNQVKDFEIQLYPYFTNATDTAIMRFRRSQVDGKYVVSLKYANTDFGIDILIPSPPIACTMLM